MTSSRTSQAQLNSSFASLEQVNSSLDLEDDTRSMASFQTTLTSTTVSKLMEQEGHVVSIIESRGAASQVGLAIFSLSAMSCALYQLTDTPTYSNTLAILAMRHPDALVLNESACKSAYPSRLYELLQKEYPQVMVFPMDRSDFNSSQGIERLRALALPAHQSSLVIDLDIKAYALAALNALIKVLEQQMTFRPHSLNIQFKPGQNRMQLDIVTIKNLELVKSLDASFPRSTLLHTIDHTSTAMGKRQLRNSILQPFILQEEILSVQKCVQYLIQHGDMMNRTREHLKEMCNFDQIISSLVCSRKLLDLDGFESKITRIFQVNSAFKNMKDILLVLSSTDLPQPLINIKGVFEKEVIVHFLNDVAQVINDDIEVGRKGSLMQHVKCYAIKEGVDSLLDTSRKAFSEVSHDVQEYVEGLRRNNRIIHIESTGFQVSCKWHRSKGFLIKCTEPEVPNYFIPSGSKQYQTLDLVFLLYSCCR